MSIEKMLFLLGLAWLSGMFFGMRIEQKLLEPLRRKKQSKNGNGGGPKPLPMTEIKLGDSFKTASQEWPLHVRRENDKAIWVTVGVNDVAFPPISNFLEHKNPNV